MPSFLGRLLLGVRRHPIRLLLESGVGYLALWGLLEPAQAFLQLNLASTPKFALLVGASLTIGLWRMLPANRASRQIAGTTTSLSIEYADVFDQRGVVAVPVNEFIDCEVGQHVSSASLHGQVIARFYNGDSNAFATATESALGDTPFDVVQRKSGRTQRFAVGTTLYLQTGQLATIPFVLTRTDPSTLKAHATVVEMWQALSGLWNAARIHCRDRPLVIPLIGGGLSGVGLSPQHLLSLLVISASSESRAKRICGEIRICLAEHLRESTDISLAMQLLN